MQSLSIIRPDDWHVHLREGSLLNYTVLATTKHFARALVMPNLRTPLINISSIVNYYQQILANVPSDKNFSPLMTFFLNEEFDPANLAQVKYYPYIMGGKLYPAYATTFSKAGVRCLKKLYPILEVMQELDLVLQIHGEIAHGDIFNREVKFIQNFLIELINNFPKLRIVLEHISSKAAVDFICSSPQTVAATITPHHLLYNRNHLLAGGIRPHYYCLPILKRKVDQTALLSAAVSGNPKFFAGTDSAPHAINYKETSCGCAGIFSAPVAVSIYTSIFEKLNRLDKLESFLSRFGAEFYYQSINKDQLFLKKIPQVIPAKFNFGAEQVVPIAAGETVAWSVIDASTNVL